MKRIRNINENDLICEWNALQYGSAVIISGLTSQQLLHCDLLHPWPHPAVTSQLLEHTSTSPRQGENLTTADQLELDFQGGLTTVPFVGSKQSRNIWKDRGKKYERLWSVRNVRAFKRCKLKSKVNLRVV